MPPLRLPPPIYLWKGETVAIARENARRLQLAGWSSRRALAFALTAAGFRPTERPLVELLSSPPVVDDIETDPATIEYVMPPLRLPPPIRLVKGQSYAVVRENALRLRRAGWPSRKALKTAAILAGYRPPDHLSEDSQTLPPSANPQSTLDAD